MNLNQDGQEEEKERGDLLGWAGEFQEIIIPDARIGEN